MAEPVTSGSSTVAAKLIAERHSLPLSVALHLAPGGLILLANQLVGVPLVRALGYPPYLGLVIAMCLALAPVQLGLLLYLGWVRNGRLSLSGVVHYLEKPVGSRALVGYVGGLIVAVFVLSVLFAPVDSFVYRQLSSGLAAGDAGGGASGYLAGYSRFVVVVTLLAPLILTGGILPAVEELYFRGFLLPRLGGLGRGAPIVNQVLFSLYHVWTPWQFVSRVGFFLPTVWATWRKEDLRISLWVHCLSNTLVTLVSVLGILLGASSGFTGR